MKEPMAFFLTWRTYGTWLHGDSRGSVDRDHNTYNTPVLGPDEQRASKEKVRLRNTEILLNPDQRAIVTEVIRQHCLWREWPLLALAVRSNHVHVVVDHAGIGPERIIGQFKTWATRRLRDNNQMDREAKIWAHHGSTRYLWDERQLRDAVTYVQDGQDIRK